VQQNQYQSFYLFQDSKLNENDFLLSELTAEDSITKKRIHLIDSNGCVANNSIIEKLSKPIQRQLKIDIKFLGFTDQAQVVYHAIAKPCKTGCILKCNIPYFKEEGGEFSKNVSFIRQKRADSDDAAVIDLNEPRSFDLEEDIYPLKTNNEIVVLNGPLKDENLQRLHLAINSATINFADVVKLLEKVKLSRNDVNYDSEKIKIQAKNGSFECLTEDMSCVLTIFLVVIQLSFLITCIIVVFLYARQLLRRADSSQREPLYSNYSVTNSSTDETEIEEIKS
jgi:predicted DNA-binding ArsR family transcriptional regulator